MLPENSFVELLSRVRGQVLDAFEHQHAPFERVVERLAPVRSPAHTPLFQVMFDYQALRSLCTRVGELEIAWRSPPYYHCNFTALPSLDEGLAAAWSDALLAMSYEDPTLRAAMDLEGVKRWLPADKQGYADLTEAMGRQGYLG